MRIPLEHNELPITPMQGGQGRIAPSPRENKKFTPGRWTARKRERNFTSLPCAVFTPAPTSGADTFEALEEACSQDSPRAQSAFENLMIH